MSTVKLGCEVALERARDLKGRIGFVTNPTGVDRELRPIWQVVGQLPGVEIRALFGPEHGLMGNVQDALPVEDTTLGDSIPIFSLFGDNLKPTPEMLTGLDMLVFDMQDVGVRFYTYMYTMAYCMQACAENGIPFCVLDRPNPICGDQVAGNILKPEFASFLGMYPIPIRHGMTIGELARLFNTEFEIGCELIVIPMENWQRHMWFDETSLDTWVMPSPNLPTLESATVYPGTCFIEGTNVSEGRGTTRPFEIIGAPWVDGEKLADELRRRGWPGVKFRSCFFTPTFWKYEGELCQGIQVHVVDRETYDPILTGLGIIQTIKELYPQEFSWRWDPQVDERCFFDLLAGTDSLRLRLDAGESIDSIIASWKPELAEFERIRDKYLIY